MVPIAGNTHDDCGVRRRDESTDGEQPLDLHGRAVHAQDLFDQRVVAFLERHRDTPFMLYRRSQLPHGPVFETDIPPAIAAISGLTRREREYAGMVARLDRTVGVILDTLDRLGIADQTLLLFASDNGHEPDYYDTSGRTQSRMTLTGRPPIRTIRRSASPRMAIPSMAMAAWRDANAIIRKAARAFRC